ncbi:chromatin-binding protein BDF1 [Ascoidea rubescens DSM 1968]|uniref:Bromodomain-containing protein n=1 Tax=Ascoidea rubescens DSM 1968 TaxID=1344418 RepID=A0A1D2VIP6_9ASCO|nr:Bromodomain-containing protein [Ascoidea rubescens DSM 1968]ODV61501.1 Bromodomain-containing protein [Ascoidea rubescens DSM 1968]
MIPAPKPLSEPDMNNLPEVSLPKDQQRYAINVIKNVKKLKDALPFLYPVDIVKLNIPYYYNYIKRPMDLSTMEKKLSVNAYESTIDFINDFNLMVDNCEKFNGINVPISKMARNIKTSFQKYMQSPKTLPLNSNGIPTIRREITHDGGGRPKREIHPPKPKDITYDNKPRKKKYANELRFCNQVLRELFSKKHENITYPFLKPVDPIESQCPTYFDVIKNPMDLGTIKLKLSNGSYENADEFEKDIRLMFQNCYIFNPSDSYVNDLGHKLEDIFNKKWKEKPLTPSTPPENNRKLSLANSDILSDDDPEIDIDIEAEVNAIPTVAVFAASIKKMQAELEALKKTEREKLKRLYAQRAKKRSLAPQRGGPRAKSKKSFSNQNSNIQALDDDNDFDMSFDMKKTLSFHLANLPDKKIPTVLQLIQDSLSTQPNPGEEVELDMDCLDEPTLKKLYKYVVGDPRKIGQANGSNLRGRVQRGGRSSAQSNKARRRTRQVVDKQIENLKKKIEQFDGEQFSNGTNSQTMNIKGDESSDDDLSSESSEEE